MNMNWVAKGTNCAVSDIGTSDKNPITSNMKLSLLLAASMASTKFLASLTSLNLMMTVTVLSFLDAIIISKSVVSVILLIMSLTSSFEMSFLPKIISTILVKVEEE